MGALPYKPGKMIPKAQYYVTEPVVLKDGENLYFEQGCEVVFAFNEKMSGINFANQNILIGTGCTFRMKYGGDLSTLNVDDKGPHILSLSGSKAVRIYGGTYSQAAGDSIYIGPKFINGNPDPCENISIANVTCKDSRRQGMSITCAKNIFVRSSIFQGIRGTPPQAGIDVEPNGPKDRIENILIKDCEAIDCASHAFVVNVSPFNTTNTVSVTFDNCRVTNTGYANTFRCVGMGKEDGSRPKGFVKVINANIVWQNE